MCVGIKRNRETETKKNDEFGRGRRLYLDQTTRRSDNRERATLERKSYRQVDGWLARRLVGRWSGASRITILGEDLVK